MKQKFGAFVLRICGLTIDCGLPPADKCVMLGAPHTTIWDFLLAYLYYAALGGSAKCMVKKEFFRIPILGSIVKRMGGIPVDRSSATAMVKSLVDTMNASEKFHLAIAPEGTRKPVSPWKAGFHLIARACNVPVYLVYFDWGRKRIGWWMEFKLTDNAREDVKRLQLEYEKMDIIAKHPENYRTR